MQQVLEEYMMKEMVRLYQKSLAILKCHFSLDRFGYRYDKNNGIVNSYIFILFRVIIINILTIF